MITVSQVAKAYGGKPLFEDASLQVNGGDRIGLIGPNGAGKSTLFSLILGLNEADEGRVVRMRGITLGYLPQESAPAGDETVIELATSVSEEMAEVLAAMRLHPDDDTDAHHEAAERFAALEGFALEVKAKRILAGLAFRESDFHRPARELSGGWIMRAHLARLLVMEPDVLMLDEPTNHLDLESLGWFQNHLKSLRGAIVAISHDREFLNEICTSILEIRRGKVVRYTGNYDNFLQQKAAREEQHLSAYKNQQREIEALQTFVNRFRAKASKAAQAQDKLKQLDRMVRIEAPESDDATVKFRFPQPARSGQRVIRMQGVVQAYGEKVIYSGLDYEVERGSRVVLVGPNGAGKSTFLKILAGLVPISAGVREPGHNVGIGYFSQQRADTLDLSRTVLDEALAATPGVGEQAVRTLLGSFLFRGDAVFKRVSVLSGGEKSRLALVKILLNPPNLLLLDEPTTHLDIPSIDALISALTQYEGTLLFVSHDVHFIRATARTVLHIHAGRLTPYAGDYDYYLEKSQAVTSRAGLVATLANHQPEAPRKDAMPTGGATVGLRDIRAQRKAEQDARQAEARSRKAREKELQALEESIAALEGRQKALVAELESPEAHANRSRLFELNEELATVEEELQSANSRWEAFAADEASGVPA